MVCGFFPKKMGGWVAGGVPPLIFLCYLFRVDFKNPQFWQAPMSPISLLACGLGGCCTRQHRGILAARTNRFRRSEVREALS
jgi:hypothetical protein